jgi:teichuronic acid biosynthesis glycosyltransferase TuaC
LRVLALTNMWPSPARPWLGAFAAVQMRSVEEAGVEVHVEFVDGSQGLRAYVRAALRMLGRNFRRGEFDLVHAHTGHCGLLACLQRRMPVVVSYVGYDLNGVRRPDGRLTLKTRIERLMFRRLPSLGAATITKSARLEAELPRRARQRNVVLPNGVDRELFRPMPREDARGELGWPDDEVVVLFASDPKTAGKRFELAEQAVARAAERDERIRLRVFAGLEHARVPLAMNAADALLLTSVAEGSPNVVKEALACDLPVVATDVGDVPLVLRGVSRCAVVPVDSAPEAVADALVDVLRDAPARNDGRRKTEYLAADAIAARLVEVYQRVAGEAPARRVVERQPAW